MGWEQKEIEGEAERLHWYLAGVRCDVERRFTLEFCRELAPLTLEINKLKMEQEAIILAHSYVVPEIVYAIADLKSDSYALALEAAKTSAKKIIFAGVVFMAETAKILKPECDVYIPDPLSGCTLADSLNGKELRRLKQKHPEAAVVCYINSTAEVKAESDVCVTSSNVMEIVAKLEQNEILFVPDRLMAENLQHNLREQGINKKIFSSQGTCDVHEHFSVNAIRKEKNTWMDLKVLSHPECTPEIVAESDFVGSTEKMMKFVKNSEAQNFLLLTECGLVNRLEVEAPQKNFVGGCRICPYMKLNSLEKILQVLKSPSPNQVVEVPEDIRIKAKKSLDRMFELTQ
jgi:quinolinate synthase